MADDDAREVEGLEGCKTPWTARASPQRTYVFSPVNTARALPIIRTAKTLSRKLVGICGWVSLALVGCAITGLGIWDIVQRRRRQEERDRKLGIL